jgi:hypothetical protein
MELPAFRLLAASTSQSVSDTAALSPTNVEASAFWALLQLDALAEDADAAQLVHLPIVLNIRVSMPASLSL